MSRRIVRRPAATNDLADQVAWYILHAGQTVADRFLEATRHTAEKLLGRSPCWGRVGVSAGLYAKQVAA